MENNIHINTTKRGLDDDDDDDDDDDLNFPTTCDLNKTSGEMPSTKKKKKTKVEKQQKHI